MSNRTPVLSSFVSRLLSQLAWFLHLLERKQGKAIILFHFETF